MKNLSARFTHAELRGTALNYSAVFREQADIHDLIAGTCATARQRRRVASALGRDRIMAELLKVLAQPNGVLNDVNNQLIGWSANNDLMMWRVNGSNPAGASKAHGLFWIDNSGNIHFGGSLSADILRNAVRASTMHAIGAELISTLFKNNGGARTGNQCAVGLQIQRRPGALPLRRHRLEP
ncbi:hypothetical protein [Stenotrophomonas rhizophila]